MSLIFAAIAASAMLRAGHPIDPWAPYRPIIASYGTSASSCCQSMAMFGLDAKFNAAHVPPMGSPPAPADGKMIVFSTPYGSLNGKPEGQGFYIPPVKGNNRAIVMCHEYWGLNGQIKQAADRLHQDTGDAVLAVDLYDGKVTDNSGQAGKLMAGVDEQRCAAILSGALRALEEGLGVERAMHIGTVGYCFGGGWSERAAIIGSQRVQACVVYYGMPDTRPSSLVRLRAPVLMFQAGLDPWINDSVVAKFKEAMAAAGKSLQVYKYHANHAFANPSNPRYDASAAKDAYAKELAFFKKNL